MVTSKFFENWVGFPFLSLVIVDFVVLEFIRIWNANGFVSDRSTSGSDRNSPGSGEAA